MIVLSIVKARLFVNALKYLGVLCALHFVTLAPHVNPLVTTQRVRVYAMSTLFVSYGKRTRWYNPFLLKTQLVEIAAMEK